MGKIIACFTSDLCFECNICQCLQSLKRESEKLDFSHSGIKSFTELRKEAPCSKMVAYFYILS